MAPLKGVNRVRKTDATGQRVERWYAWRGKGAPCILSESAVSDRVLDLKVAAAATAAGERYFQLMSARKAPPKNELLGLIKAWLASPEFQLHSPRTQKDYAAWIRAAETDLGTLPLAALKADGCRAALLAWRNRYAATPANADHFASALSNCLQWARDQGLTSADPMRNWPWIYHPDRSEILYVAGEVEVVCAEAHDDPEFQVAFLLATYSGLRKCDLLKLPKTAIGESTIVRRTSKRGRVVHIPITEALRQVLDVALAMTPADCLTVLSKNGKPWKASTLDKAWAFYRAKAIAKMPSIEGKRWHDLRGTFATSLHRLGYEDDEVDRIMGWAKGNSEQTRAAYVSGDVVAHTAIARACRRFAAAA
jgi:integrase